MSYPLGTICVGQNCFGLPYLNGMECEVIGPCRFQRILDQYGQTVDDHFYDVRWSNGEETVALHRQLKRKDLYDEEKRAEYQMRLKSKDREKVSNLISDCLKAIEEAKQ